MKKRSMLAIATLATGFVVAAITPSHPAEAGTLGDRNVADTLDTAGQLLSHDKSSVDDKVLGQE
ncbi:hypothetical protein ABZ079_16500 [Streptomyces sp. NPDC006314]|uniref:hypothetical protein n=1 Tax=Streptomyces sp. NPDC006314 TaxID=3154475 RepID=UPI0033A7BDE5